MVGGVDLGFNSGVDFDRLRPSLRNTHEPLWARSAASWFCCCNRSDGLNSIRDAYLERTSVVSFICLFRTAVSPVLGDKLPRKLSGFLP